MLQFRGQCRIKQKPKISEETKDKSKTYLRNSQEEITIQGFGYSSKQSCIHILAFENFVGITAVAMQLHCQPSYRATLKFQLLPNHFSDMQFVSIHSTKKRKPLHVNTFHKRGSAIALNKKINTNSSRLPHEHINVFYSSVTEKFCGFLL